jgi:SNF2 family DNA or RNA helicase
MGNDPSELWAQLHLLNPKRYSSFWRFFEMYVDYVEEWHGGKTILGVRNPELLRRELSTIMFSRSKEDVWEDLPEKLYQTIPLELTDDQKRMYRKATKDLRIKLDSGELDILNGVSLILRLRQIISSPMGFQSTARSSKVEAVLDFVDSTREKVVVFTQFRDTVEHISRELDKRDVGHVVLMGGFDPDQAKKEFQEADECQVFVATTATGGVGLTLTAAKNLIFVDKHWNPVQQKQAEDRLHRIGQDRNCHIIDLYCPGTVDGLVEKVLTGKLQMNVDVFGEALYNHLEEWA